MAARAARATRAGSPAPAGSALSERARERRRAILDAGRELFLERGYAGTSLAEVVARSGGSLATLYELFGNKRGLFEAILREFADDVLGPLSLEGVPEDPRRGLEAIARRYLELALEPRAVAWWRTLCHEAPKVPELRELFLSERGSPLQRGLAEHLDRLSRAGYLEIAEPARAAGMFLELVRGPLHRRALGGDATAARPVEIERQARAAVDLFLHGCLASDRRAAARRPRPRTSRRSS